MTNDSRINGDVYHLLLDSLFDWTAKKIKNNHFIFEMNTTHLIKHAKWWQCGILLFEIFIIAYCYCFTCYFWPTLGNVYCNSCFFCLFLSGCSDFQCCLLYSLHLLLYLFDFQLFCIFDSTSMVWPVCKCSNYHFW